MTYSHSKEIVQELIKIRGYHYYHLGRIFFNDETGIRNDSLEGKEQYHQRAFLISCAIEEVDEIAPIFANLQRENALRESGIYDIINPLDSERGFRDI